MSQIMPDHAVAHMVVDDGALAILLDKVNKWYAGTLHVLRDVSMAVAEERVVVCSPSNSASPP